MVWLLAFIPLAGAVGAVRSRAAVPDRRTLGLIATGTLALTLGLGLWAAITHPTASFPWGAGLALTAEVDRIAGVMAVLVPTIALPVTLYAVAHEDDWGLSRLIALLLAFAGAMQLLVIASDLLTLLIGWELVGVLSWALIGHDWRDREAPAKAAHAFNATRLGDLGLFLAAGAAFASTGSLAYGDLVSVSGGWRDLMVAGILLAAVAKSGQGPFAPWLFSAMAGPTPVSALLHAATMVAAGAYLLIRLAVPLGMVGWFGPVTMAIGLITAIAGGVVAALQRHPKRLLAASTSAQFGLMFVAIGAGSAGAGAAHLVAHAGFKSLLFLAAGVAMVASGSEDLGEMRLGDRLPKVARLSAVGALALAAVPPLGGAWTKEEVITAAGEVDIRLAALTILAGALSALYATRFHLLAYGPARDAAADPREIHAPGRVEVGALTFLAAASLALGLLWLPGAKEVAATVLGDELPTAKLVETLISVAVVAATVAGAFALDRRSRLLELGVHGQARRVGADWLGLPTATKTILVDPSLALAATLARFDDHVVDGGVRGVAAFARWFSRLLGGGVGVPGSDIARRGRQSVDHLVDLAVEGLAAATQATATISRAFDDRGVDAGVDGLAAGVGVAGRRSRRLQSGAAHAYYVIVAIGLVAIVAGLALGR